MPLIATPTDPAAWHALRLGNIGGSEVASLMLPPDMLPDYALSRFALHHIKAGHAPAPEVDNVRTRWGIALEQVIAEAAAEQEGWTILPGAYATDATTPGMACTLDRIIQFDPAEEGPGALECKNVDWMVHRRTWQGEPPAHILLQHQHQLACTGYTWGAVAALVGGNRMEVYRYRAKPKLIASIRAKVAEFWRHVREDREPVVDGSDATAAVLRALYPPEPEPIDLRADNELPSLCARLLGLGEDRKRIAAEEAEAKNRIMAKVAGHRRAMVEGFSVSLAVTPAKEARPALPNEMIPGRAETRRITVKEYTP